MQGIHNEVSDWNKIIKKRVQLYNAKWQGELANENARNCKRKYKQAYRPLAQNTEMDVKYGHVERTREYDQAQHAC